MDLVDIGVNLAHDSFDHDREALVERAVAAGVRRFIITGTDIAGSRKALAMSTANPGFHCTAGVHPHHAADLDADGVKALRELLAARGIEVAQATLSRDIRHLGLIKAPDDQGGSAYVVPAGGADVTPTLSRLLPALYVGADGV
ncbi:MAG: TatD family hydrolase, partial [Proteobacteria bacterium]|nr:TatD family hydrolase [Pseudomonadota bacterium]